MHITLPRRGPRSRRSLPVLALLTAAAMTLPVAAASAEAPQGGHAFGDASSTGRQVADGPSAPGLAWETDLGFALANETGTSILASNGLAIFQGRAVTDVPGTPENEADDTRGVMVAIDPTDGSIGWDVPAMDIAWECPAVATSDGRIITTLKGQTLRNPDFDQHLVALDAETGDLLPGQEYDGEAQGDGRMQPCSAGQRMVLSPDETLALVQGYFTFDHRIRAIVIDEDAPNAWTLAWEVDLEEVDGSEPSVETPITAATDGSGFYIVHRWDRSTDPDTYRLAKYDWDGNPLHHLDLPSPTNSFTDQTMVAVDGGVTVGLDACAGAAPDATSTECLTFYDDQGGAFTERWTAYATSRGGNNTFNRIRLLDDDTLGGWSEIGGGAGIVGLSVADGSLLWQADTAFSANGNQFITDASGNGYFSGFGEHHVRSITPEGRFRWTIPFCHLDTGEATIVGPIGRDGTLITMRGDGADQQEVFRGFRADAELPKGACPEQEERVSGLNRVETSVQISGASFTDDGSADTVVIATASNYPDALAGGPLARSLDAPLLLTSPSALSAATRAEIERLGASNAVLLGGVGALSPAVEEELAGDMGLTVDRIAGGNRFHTAQLIAERIPATTAYVTEGINADSHRGWPDAVAVSGLASLEQRPILLVAHASAPQPTLDALDAMNATDAIVVGGEGAVSTAVVNAIEATGVAVERLSGTSRFGTSVEVAKRSVAAGATTFDLWFATGLSFPDALAAGPAVAKDNGVLLLVHGTRPEGGSEVYGYLESLDDADVLRTTFVGGTGALTDDVAAKLLSSAGIG